MLVEQIIWSLAFTTHIGFIGDYNSVHPHIRYTDNNYIVGAFYNSDSRISMYAGYRFELTERAGIEVSATNGYQALGGIVPQLRGTYQTNENIILFAAPSAEKIDETINIGLVVGIETTF